MASDALVPETSVLAVASHVGPFLFLGKVVHTDNQ